MTAKIKAPFLIAMALLLVGVFGAYTYGFTRVNEINTYYAGLLKPRKLAHASGPHYWKDGRIFWCGRHYLESSGDFGLTVKNEMRLPDGFKPPARSLSDHVLGDASSVYFSRNGEYRSVLFDFLCWYVCSTPLRSGDLVIGEYGSRIYKLDFTTGQPTLLFNKPAAARHFHFTAVDPFTDEIYVGLGDALKKYERLGDRVTGIMRSKDQGHDWTWIYKTTVGSGEINRQPTSIYFEKDRIYFGSDSNPHGIFALDRRTDEIEQVFVMSDVLRSWFLAIVEARGSYWALSRSFGKDNFGVLWWSGDSKSWTPVQFFSHVPFWLQTDEQHNLISVGFGEERNYRLVKDGPVRVMNVPDRDTMAVQVRHGPTITLLDRIFRRRIMPQ